MNSFISFKVLTSLYIFLSFSHCFCFNKSDFDKVLDKEIKSFIKKNNTAGLAIGFIKASYDLETPISHIYTYGDARKFPQITMKDSTLFRLGRVSHIFLGLLLSKAISDDLIHLDNLAVNYLPKSFCLPKFHEHEMTIKDLAFHLSSLPNEPTTIMKRYQSSVYDIKNYLKNYKLTRKPGTKFQRSDLGYSLLSQCLEYVFKDKIDEVLKREIFNDLNMTTTSLKEYKKHLEKLAVGYQGVKIVSQDKIDKDYSFFSPSTGVLSTPYDVQQLMKFFLNIEEFNLSKYLKTFYQNHLLIPDQYIDKIALGPLLSQLCFDNGLSTYKISSQYYGYSSSIVFIPDTKTSVFILSNSEDSTEALALKILSELNR